MSRKIFLFALVLLAASAFSITSVNDCRNLTTSGETYVLANDLSDAAVDVSVYFGHLTVACLVVRASNIVLDCDGHSISSGSSSDIGIMMVPNESLNGITIRNCPNISGYYYGVYAKNVSNSNFTYIGANNNGLVGLYVTGSGDNITHNTLNENGINGGYGGLYLAGNNHIVTDNTADDNQVGGTGFYFRGINNGHIANNSAAGNQVQGFSFYAAYDENFDPEMMNNNVIWNNTATDGGHGFLFSADTGFSNGAVSNHFANNTARGNAFSGFIINGANSTEFTNNAASDNGFMGFGFSDVRYTNVTGNNASNNAQGGFVFRNLGGLPLADYIIRNNTASGSTEGNGFTFDGYTNNANISNNTAHHNSVDGFGSGQAVFSTDNLTFANNKAYGNDRGIYLQLTNSTMRNNIAWNNTGSGIDINGDNITLSGDAAFDNLNGFSLFANGNGISARGLSAHGNSGDGITLDGSSSFTNVSGSHFYNNSDDISVKPYIGLLWLDRIVVDNPYGNLTNYTMLSLEDNANEAYGYKIRHANGSGLTYPSQRFSFAEKFVEIVPDGPMTFDSLALHWNVSELSGYSESQFELWKHNDSGWTLLNSTPNSHTLRVDNHDPGSVYAILQNGPTPPSTEVGSCMEITAPGTYVQTANLAGAPISASPQPGYTCIKISSPDVIFDGAGFDISNDGTAGTTYGVVLAGGVTDAMVKDSSIDGYSYGIYNDGTLNTLSQITVSDYSDYAIYGPSGGNTYNGLDLYSVSGNFLTGASSPNEYNAVTFNQLGGKLYYGGPLQVTAPFDSTNAYIDSNVVSVDATSAPEFDSSAIVTLYATSCNPVPKIFALLGLIKKADTVISSGNECTVCQMVSCSGNTATFSVPGFTAYAVSSGLNTSLVIFDDNDPEGGSKGKMPGDDVFFYANYSNSSSGLPINGSIGSCNVSFSEAPNGPFAMIYNGTSGLWQYDRVINGTNIIWNVSCMGTGYDPLNATDSLDLYRGATLYGANITNATDLARYTGIAAGNYSTEGGNISALDIYGESLTDRWAAFFGNISGLIALRDNAGNLVYDWAWTPSAGGVICASTNSSLNDLYLAGATGADIDNAWGFAGSASDSGNNTFNATGCTLDIGATSVGNCNYADTGPAGGFITCATKTNTSPTKEGMLFCTNISAGGALWNGGTGDFEMMVPTAYGPNATETYYFYLNLN